METPGRSFGLAELASLVGAELRGDPEARIHGVNGLAEARPGDVSFYANPRYRAQLHATRASAVLASSDPPGCPQGAARLLVPNPHLAFAKVSAAFHPERRAPPGVAPGAHVHPEAKVHPEACVMAGATVERGATVGARSVLFPGAYVGEGAAVGEDCVLHPSSSVLHGCVLGARVTLHASSVIGSDGFGYAFDPEGPRGPEHFKIPQAGIVRVEDDVEVGACACVDRATLGETLIGRGTKVDNLVQIAHNVKVGPLSLLCAQAGVAGSSELGTGVILAGQVGVVGHLKVGDMAKVGAQSGVAQDVPDGAVLSGSPAFDHKAWLKSSAAYEQLPELLKEIRALRRRVEALEKERSP
ncbi:MAG TPA: UDP-3-O-(3-hydroxymyristoyl)glucosamine N-acyltransferase [Myxococcaceae bacterium]